MVRGLIRPLFYVVAVATAVCLYESSLQVGDLLLPALAMSPLPPLNISAKTAQRTCTLPVDSIAQASVRQCSAILSTGALQQAFH